MEPAEHVKQLLWQYGEDTAAAAHVAQLIGKKKANNKIGLSEERLNPLIPIIRDYIAYWREYPDMFIDFLQTGQKAEEETEFKFYFYQRVFLRAAMRYKYVYMTFPRACGECAKVEKIFSTDKLL